MSRLFLPAAVFMALVACNPFAGGSETPWEELDDDGDGLINGDEQVLGTDPASSDSDSDGLADGEEVALGTNPLALDSDDDTYADAHEIQEGTSPTDPESRIYEGYWPYNPDKGSLEEGDFDTFADENAAVPRYIGVDQFGDEVDLYDLAGYPVIIDISAVWCPPCNDMSAWLAGEADWGSPYDDARQRVWDGEVYWVTVLYQNRVGGEADEDVVANWDEDYPADNVIVMTDPGWLMANHVNPPGIPSLSLIDEDMRWDIVDSTSEVLYVVADGDF